MSSIPYVIDEVMTVVMSRYPFYASLMRTTLKLQLIDNRHRLAKRARWAAVTDTHLIVNTDGIAELPTMDNKVFVFLHEVAHKVLDHPAICEMYQKRGTCAGRPWNLLVANYATDYHVNGWLIAGGVEGYMSDWLYEASLDPVTMTFEDIYAKIYDAMHEKPKEGEQGEGEGSGDGASGDAGEPSEDDGPPEPGEDDEGDEGAPSAPDGGNDGEPDDGEPQPGETQDGHMGSDRLDGMSAEAIEAEGEQRRNVMRVAVSEAVQVAREAGNMPAGLQVWVDKLMETRVNFRAYLQCWCRGKIGGSSKTHLRPHRRYVSRGIFLPAPSGRRFGHLVFALDTSGSMLGEPLRRSAGAVLKACNDLKPRQVTVLFADTKVYDPLVFNSRGMSNFMALVTETFLKLTGGGGTSFVPPFEYLVDHQVRPDAVIYATDGYGEFPTVAPPYPVLWAVINDDAKPNFGTVVNIITGHKHHAS